MFLPEELMTLILAKLPVKSLLRFKCVQKSWYSLIQSPQFIHLHQSSSSPQFVFNLRVTEPFDYEKACEPFYYEKACEPRRDPTHVLSFYSYETLEHLGGINDIDIPLSNPNGFVSLCGSCDGLVCITNHFDTDYGDPYDPDTEQILICNPATREWRSLPVPSVDYFVASVAFGSDPSSTPGQYKVVMIGMPWGECDRLASVYDFSTDSWRETGVVFPPPFDYSPRAVSLNGVFHWYGSGDDIVTFHMSKEVAGSIPLPEFARPSAHELYVSSKSQQLSLVVCDPVDVGWEVLVMTKYGIKESWTRLFKIRPVPRIREPVSFWEAQQQQAYLEPFAFRDEQKQLLLLDDRQLVSCDLQRQNQLRYFPIDLTTVNDSRPITNTLVSYSESLVSVKAMRSE